MPMHVGEYSKEMSTSWKLPNINAHALEIWHMPHDLHPSNHYLIDSHKGYVSPTQHDSLQLCYHPCGYHQLPYQHTKPQCEEGVADAVISQVVNQSSHTTLMITTMVMIATMYLLLMDSTNVTGAEAIITFNPYDHSYGSDCHHVPTTHGLQ